MMELNALHVQRCSILFDCTNVSVYKNLQDGNVFYSIDGNFGLCRKRASGSSVRPPLHQQTMFFSQESIDKYVETYGRIQLPPNKVYTGHVQVLHFFNNCDVSVRSAISF